MPGLEKMDDFFAARVDGYDDHTPLLADHETEILRHAGFRHVQILKKWGESTYTIIAHTL